MEGWQQDLIKTLETVAEGVEQFLQEVGKEVSEAADALLDFTEEVAEEIERAFTPFEEGVSPHLDPSNEPPDWFEPLLAAILGFESTLDRAAEPFTHTVEPLINQHPVCVGCRNYHGQVYNGTMLVCAMHPYGIVDGADQCPDKELFSWSFPPTGRSDSFED
ncbi:MAG TPA: hypothetical protein V6C57_25285 [Coleofasciculaceae cyanobacterium]